MKANENYLIVGALYAAIAQRMHELGLPCGPDTLDAVYAAMKGFHAVSWIRTDGKGHPIESTWRSPDFPHPS